MAEFIRGLFRGAYLLWTAPPEAITVLLLVSFFIYLAIHLWED